MPTESRLADFTRVPTEPIPLSVLTGFLGSGKTTFLSRVLAVLDLKDTAVISSEFGAVALDHLDHVSRLVFVVQELEPDEILRRFAAGEPACLPPPAGAT